jgi:hypothetical protein
VLPLAGLLLVAGLGLDVRSVYLEHPVGQGATVVAALLVAVGVRWTDHLVARATSLAGAG